MLSEPRAGQRRRAFGFLRGPALPSRGWGYVGSKQHRPRHPVIRVGTFNVQGGKGRDGRRINARAADVLHASDLVGLQEIRGRGHMRQLGDRLATESIYLPAETRWFQDYRGNGLLSRLSVGAWTVHPLTNRREKGFRSLAHIRVGTRPDGFDCFVTHGSKHEDRDDHLNVILERFSRCDRGILMGDLNTQRDHPLLGAHLQGAASVDALGAALGPADRSSRIDWILTRGFDIRGGGVEDSGVSDHPYYWVDLERNDRGSVDAA